MNQKQKQIPTTVFIVPYRNRKEQLFFFSKYMGELLKNDETVEFYISHQNDKKPFSRGTTKNVGFLAIKSKYPDHYKTMNFVFNDVDTIPYNNIFSYQTQEGKVGHYYGFTHSLGGIVVIKGSDFEKINGYPCLYTWGREDSILQQRCEYYGLEIDRSHFYPVGSPEILQLFDGVSRIVNPSEIRKTDDYDLDDGVNTISKLYYTIDKKSKNELEDGFLVESEKMFVVNIFNFTTKYSYHLSDFKLYDLRNSEKDVTNKNNRNVESFIDTDWTDTSYQPVEKDRTIYSKPMKIVPPVKNNTPSYHQQQLQRQKLQEIRQQQQLQFQQQQTFRNNTRPMSATELYYKRNASTIGKNRIKR
jgi:hypothetical protein